MTLERTGGQGAPVHRDRPRLTTIVRRLAHTLLTATLIPSVLFYLCLIAGGIWVALASAIAWCYGMLAWRALTHQRSSALLWVTTVGLTAKTILSVATGSTFVYFLQPAVTDAVIALLFLISLGGTRPVVGRVAADFYPMTDEVALRPRVQQLFWRLTLMWALLCLAQATVTFWLLESASLNTFVAARTGITISFAALGAVVTVMYAARIAHSEHLLHRRDDSVGIPALALP